MELTKRVQNSEQENRHLLTALKSSDSVKDVEILQLKQRIQELEQSKDSQNVLCESLSEETESLRDKLKDTVEQCQKMERKLSTLSTSRVASVDEGVKSAAGNVVASSQLKQVSACCMVIGTGHW